MKIRRLELKDAPLMYEWMHDVDVIQDLNVTLPTDDKICKCFISKSIEEWNDIEKAKNLHWAITDDDDNYMGTVSLKDIDYISNRAEFAIAVRKLAMGHGYAMFGMKEALEFGHKILHLNLIYWCVNEKNLRAIKFYDKNEYKEYKNVDSNILLKYRELMNSGAVLKWYASER